MKTDDVTRQQNGDIRVPHERCVLDTTVNKPWFFKPKLLRRNVSDRQCLSPNLSPNLTFKSRRLTSDVHQYSFNLPIDFYQPVDDTRKSQAVLESLIPASVTGRFGGGGGHWAFQLQSVYQSVLYLKLGRVYERGIIQVEASKWGPAMEILSPSPP